MSRWLNSVNSLLEQLDGKVETAVEDQIHRDEGDQQGVQANVLEDILTKRGLSTAEEEDAKEESEKATDAEDSLDNTLVASDGQDKVEATVDVVNETETTKPSTETGDMEGLQQETGMSTAAAAHEELGQQIGRDDEASPKESEQSSTNTKLALAEQNDSPVETVAPVDIFAGVENNDAMEDAEPVSPDASSPAVSESPQPEVVMSPPPSVEPIVGTSDQQVGKDYDAAVIEAKEAQKQARTLRRHVVSLNTQLEAAEAEMTAQRTELERAAERMERDRTRHKEEKERQATRHAEELKTLKQLHDVALAEHKARSDEQLEESRKRLREVEERRMQEGGDWTKELEEAVQREQAGMQRLAMLEDEKSTLLSQVSTLQSQQAALESRLDSVGQTADNAMERETEAEDRLDSALSLHARQLSQRQAREAELERTVADLGAALVVARDRELSRLKNMQQEGGEGINGSSSDGESLQAKLEACGEELESVNAQLALERQRCQTLHNELREVSQERTEEASAAHARQLQYDRQTADMSLTISRLQSSLRELKQDSFRENKELGSRASIEEATQIKTLSEQILRQQEKIGSYTTEISTLKARLRSSLSRAEKAEQALAAPESTGDMLDVIERAPSSGTMRRRGGRRGAESYGGSIRSAIALEPGQTEGKEKIGKAIDALDTWSVQTGKYLRYNPLARGGVLLYLLLLHLWTFLLLVFHVHSFETVHGDFGAGRQLPHGPHALMQNTAELPHNP